ncbi:FAM156A/FAM156B-like [Sigmodon hispidus]
MPQEAERTEIQELQSIRMKFGCDPHRLVFHKHPPELSEASSQTRSPMDPLQKWDPVSISMPSRMATVTSSPEASVGSQPSSEKLSTGLSSPSLGHSPSSSEPAPLSAWLLQQQAHEKKALWQQYWGKQGFPQRKKVFLRHSRCWHREHMAPYLLERDVRGAPSGDRAQNQLLCQGHVPNIAGMSGNKYMSPNPPSWETLVQGLNGLTLSLGANRPSTMPHGNGEQKPEQMLQLERQQDNMRMFQRTLN